MHPCSFSNGGTINLILTLTLTLTVVPYRGVVSELESESPGVRVLVGSQSLSFEGNSRLMSRLMTPYVVDVVMSDHCFSIGR